MKHNLRNLTVPEVSCLTTGVHTFNTYAHKRSESKGNVVRWVDCLEGGAVWGAGRVPEPWIRDRTGCRERLATAVQRRDP